MVALQKFRFVVLVVCFLIKEVSKFGISTWQNWTSPLETLQEKEKIDPLHATVGCKVMKL